MRPEKGTEQFGVGISPWVTSPEIDSRQHRRHGSAYTEEGNQLGLSITGFDFIGSTYREDPQFRPTAISHH